MRRMLFSAATIVAALAMSSASLAVPPEFSRPSAPNQAYGGGSGHHHSGHGGGIHSGWNQGSWNRVGWNHGSWNRVGWNQFGGFRRPIGGWGISRPWLVSNNSISLSVGSPYGFSSFSYFNGPWVGNPNDYLWSSGYGGNCFYGSYNSFNLSPYGVYYSPRYNSVDYYLPPVYYPAELAYGPLAVKQFMGVDRNFGLAPLRADPPRVAARPAVEPIRPVVHEVDWTARKNADRYLELGDNYFQKQKFYDAILRYRLAVKQDPAYSIARLKLGFALLTNRRFDEAAAEFSEAVKLDPEIVKSDFRIDQLYDDNRIAREAHEEMLAQEALDHPTDGNIHFDLGMWLLFHGQPERSRSFFAEAKRLGLNVEHVAAADDAARDL